MEGRLGGVVRQPVSQTQMPRRALTQCPEEHHQARQALCLFCPPVRPYLGDEL